MDNQAASTNTNAAAAPAPETKVSTGSANQTAASKAAENVAKSQEQKGDRADAGTVKEAAQEAFKKYKVKVEGQDLEVDEKELLRGYSHQRAANKVHQEGLKAKKQAETFIEMMKDKAQLFDAIQKLGHDPRKLSEEFLASQLEEEMMDPKDRALKQAHIQLKAFQDLEKKQKEAEEKQRNDTLKAKYAKEYETTFIEALSNTPIPQTQRNVARIAKYVSDAAKLKIDMTAGEAAKLVQEDLEKERMADLKELPAEYLVKLIGEEGLKKLREYDTSRLMSPEKNLTTPPKEAQGEPKKARQRRGPMDYKQWRQFNRG